MKHKSLLFCLLFIGISLFGNNKNSLFLKQKETKSVNDKTIQTYGFIENKGQILDQNFKQNKDVYYLLDGNGINVQLRKKGFSYDLIEVKENNFETHRIDINLLNANDNFEIVSYAPLANYTNYINEYGNFEHVRSFTKVLYKNIYSKIDLEFVLDENNNVKYNFILHKGANVKDIQLQYKGAKDINLKNNKIELNTNFGLLSEKIPRSYQFSNDNILVLYEQISQNIFGFKVVEKYNPEIDLIIDPFPTRNWGAYFGGQGNLPSGNGADVIYRLSPRVGGGVIAAGRTTSFTNIATSGAYQTTLGANEDAFITAFNANGSIAWSTYYGGVGTPEGFSSVATDSAGNIFHVMVTAQSGFETASTGFETPYQGAGDFLVSKFNSLGERQWATYAGGSGAETFPSNTQNTIVQGNYIAVNPAGTMLYIVGATASTNADVGFSPQQPTIGGGGRDGYIAQIDATLAFVNWASYCGGTNVDDLTGVAIAPDGSVYACGNTTSATTANIQGAAAGYTVFDASYTGSQNAMLVKYEPVNGLRLFGTYLGNNVTNAWDIAVDGNGDCYMVGSTNSNTGIATTGQTVYGGSRDGFVAKFNALGSRSWSSYIGGSGDDAAYEITYYNNEVYIGGRTASNTSFATTGAYQTTIGSAFDGFFSILPSSGGVPSNSYYGGNGDDTVQAICISNGSLYLGGNTVSTNGIATVSNATYPVDDVYGGLSPFDPFIDAFVAQFTESTLGTNEVNFDSILSIYPNPSNSIFNIDIDSEATIEGFDIVGKQIFIKKNIKGNNQLDMSNYSDGLYLLKITNDKNESKTIKIVKQ